MSEYFLFNKNLRKRIRRRIGIDDSPNERLTRILEKELKKSKELLEPRKRIKEFEIIVKKEINKIFVKNGFEIVSQKLAQRLKECSRVSLAVITIGSRIEETTGDSLRDLIRDVIGSQLAEELINEVNNEIKQMALAQGYETVKRFSVGYSDWGIKDQVKIIELLGADFIKVDKKSYLMSPQKSITAIIGWKKSE